MEKDSISYTELDFELIKMEVKEMEKLIKRLKVGFSGSTVIIDQLEVEVWNHCLRISDKVSFSGDPDSKNPPAMQETQVWSLGWADPLEKGMASHSSVLAWRISWTKEPGRLQSMGLQRIGHDWATNTSTLWWASARIRRGIFFFWCLILYLFMTTWHIPCSTLDGCLALNSKLHTWGTY